MCQLCFISSPDPKINEYILYIQNYINSKTDNKDGFGFFPNSKGNVFKTAVCPSNCTNLGKLIKNLSSTKLMSHVRKATWTNGKKEIHDENSHPFEKEKIILIHNGSLEFKDPEKMKNEKYDKMIDSEIFAEHLNSKYTDNKSFVDALKETMEDFYGKFALIIYDKKENRYYVAKGKTAKLYYADISYGIDKNDRIKFGLIINTDKDSLVEGSLIWSNILQISTDKFFLDLSDRSLIKDIEDESIYEVVYDSLVRVGDIKENIRPQIVKVVSDDEDWRGRNTNQDWWARSKKPNKSLIDNSISRLHEYLSFLSLTIEEVDLISVYVLGKGLFEYDEIDFKKLVEVLEILRSMATKRKRKVWKSIKTNGKILLISNIYTKYNIKFPWMTENLEKLESVRSEILNENQSKFSNIN